MLADARRAAAGRSPRAVRVGGDEEVGLLHHHHGGGRTSHDAPARRSLSLDAEEKVRRGVAELLARARGGHGRGSAGPSPSDKDGGGAAGPAEAAPDHLPPVANLPRVQAAYLLVSPPVGVAATLATMSFSVPFLRRAKKPAAGEAEVGGAVGGTEGLDGEAEQKLVAHPTLAIYGDADSFLSSKKVREWAARLGGAPGSLFRAHEVSTAGHFWAEGRTIYVLRNAVGAFGTELLRKGWADEEEK